MIRFSSFVISFGEFLKGMILDGVMGVCLGIYIYVRIRKIWIWVIMKLCFNMLFCFL